MSDFDVRERRFEQDIEEYLITKGGYRKGNPAIFDREIALDRGTFITFIKDSQPKKWGRYEKIYGSDSEKQIIERFCREVKLQGLLKVLTEACGKYKTPLNDGDAVITPAFKITNARAIIHAVGPNFAVTPTAFKELFDAYYNSLVVLKDNGYHSISFPLISSGIFGGSLDNPVAESTKQCLRAYRKFISDYPEYDIDVKLCAFMAAEMKEAEREYEAFKQEN